MRTQVLLLATVLGACSMVAPAGPTRAAPGPSVTAFTAGPALTNAVDIVYTMAFDTTVNGLTAEDFDASGTATGCAVQPPLGSGTARDSFVWGLSLIHI